jgi:hypothetical protein
MSRFVHSNVASAIDIQTGAVVSRVIFTDDRIEVTVFGFDAGAGLSEHQASRAPIVQVTKGRLEFIADSDSSTRARASGSTWSRERRTVLPRSNQQSCSSPLLTPGETSSPSMVEAHSWPDLGLRFC